ncbi:MAG: DUF6141 family protein [Thermodesulfobacteriota bacterium]
MPQNDQGVLFRETQRFSQARWWGPLIVAVVVMSVVSAGVIVSHVFFGQPVGGPRSVGVIVVFAAVLIPVGAAILLRLFEMTTEVRTSGLYVRMYPFHLSFRRIDLSDLTEIRVRRYRPIVEYGGYGIRIGWKGSAYNVSGNLGVDLIFAHRRPLLIGSQMPRRLAEVLGEIWRGPRVDMLSKE